MKLIQLTQIAHPDINAGLPGPVFANAENVKSIERGTVSYAKVESLERMREAYAGVANCIDGVFKAARGLDLDSLLGEPAKLAGFNETVAKYSAAVQASPSIQAEHHPRVECTVVKVSSMHEWGMLFVTETPSEVAEIVALAVNGEILSAADLPAST